MFHTDSSGTPVSCRWTSPPLPTGTVAPFCSSVIIMVGAGRLGQGLDPPSAVSSWLVALPTKEVGIRKTAMTPISTHSHHRRRKVLLAGFRDVLSAPVPWAGA